MPTYNLPNEQGRTPRDNCVACVAVCLLYQVSRQFRTAQDLDREHSLTSRLRGCRDNLAVMNKAVELIQEATRLRVVPNEAGKPYRRLGFDPLPAGHYAVFDLSRRNAGVLASEPATVTYHVVYGCVYDYHDQRRRRSILEFNSLFDPQSSEVLHRGRLGADAFAVQFAR